MKKAIMAFIKRILSVPRMLRDRSVVLWKKIIVIAAMVYLVLPVDIIPPFLLPIGWIDDLVIWIALTYFMRDTLDAYWKLTDKDDFSSKYKDSVEVDYEVKDEQEAKEKNS